METTEKKVLSMKFYSEGGSRSINMDDPVQDIDGENVSLAMEEIIDLSTVCDSKGNLVDTVKSADLITTTKTVETLF